jgi:Mrp family chromosome partitioning ATPase
VKELLEVKNDSRTTPTSPAWPSSLYATPRVAPWQTPSPTTTNETFVAEDIMEGCRQAMQHVDLEELTSLGFTSAMRGEGRSTLALAAALVFAEYGLNTVLLELDLGHPELASRLGVAKFPGLSDLADGRATLADTMRPVSPGLSIIPAGQSHGSIPRVLRQLARINVFENLGSQGHVVVADLPPLLGNSVGRQAASLLADLVLVVRARVVGAASIKEAVDGLQVTPRVLLNGTHSHVPGWALRLSGV